MNKFYENIRYGTLTFLYLISTIFIFNITSLTENLICFTSFIAFSIFLYILTTAKKKYLIKTLTVVALIFGIVLEFYSILNIFRYSSDNKGTMLGSLIFALVILSVSFLVASKSGFYSLLKVSNIIFFLPLIPILILPLFFISALPYTYGVFHPFENSQILYNLLNGLKCAIFLFSDIFIINIMQKNENCYLTSASRFFYFTALIIVTITNIIFRFIFGVNITNELISPIFSSLSIIGRLGLDEIVSFIFSVCFLFRISCKISILLSLFKVTKKRSLSFILVIIFTVLSALFGTLLIYKNIVDINILFNLTVFIYFISYVLAPTIGGLFYRNKNGNLPSTGFLTKK